MIPMRNARGQIDGLVLDDADLHEALEVWAHKKGYAYTGYQLSSQVLTVTIQPGVSWMPDGKTERKPNEPR